MFRPSYFAVGNNQAKNFKCRFRSHKVHSILPIDSPVSFCGYFLHLSPFYHDASPAFYRSSTLQLICSHAPLRRALKLRLAWVKFTLHLEEAALARQTSPEQGLCFSRRPFPFLFHGGISTSMARRGPTLHLSVFCGFFFDAMNLKIFGFNERQSFIVLCTCIGAKFQYIVDDHKI